jgi:outer membrane protein assembly factor BamD (BamD/ComL family)
MHRIIIMIALPALLLSCGGNKEDKQSKQDEMVAEIKGLEKTLYNTDVENPEFNYQEAMKVTKLYQAFADSFPDDERTPDFLFKGAQVAIGMAQYHLALSFLERCFNAYPKYENHVDCLYLQGFIYDTYLSYKGIAKERYETLIKQFPNHAYAKDAAAAIKTLTMSDEDLIKMFKEKEKEDSLQRADS